MKTGWVAVFLLGAAGAVAAQDDVDRKLQELRRDHARKMDDLQQRFLEERARLEVDFQRRSADLRREAERPRAEAPRPPEQGRRPESDRPGPRPFQGIEEQLRRLSEQVERLTQEVERLKRRDSPGPARPPEVRPPEPPRPPRAEPGERTPKLEEKELERVLEELRKKRGNKNRSYDPDDE